MKLNINPFNKSNPMTFKDAAAVATLTAIAVWILNFLANATIGEIRVDPAAFAFDCIKTYLTTWAGNFITLAGLEQLMKRREE